MTAGIRYFAFSNLFLFALCVFTLLTPPEASVAADFLVLGLTYGVILAIAGGVFGGVRLICQAEGEMDWGEAVSVSPSAVPSGSRTSAPTTA